jgi:hypothetical protein
MYTLLRCGKNNKHTNTQIHTIAGLFQVFNKKKIEKQEKKKKNYDVSAMLLLLGRTSERTRRVQQRREKLGRLAADTERKKSACMWQQ